MSAMPAQDSPWQDPPRQTAAADEARRFVALTQDGARLEARISGSGRPLLLISGLGGTAGFWESNAATLSRSFQVVRFDQRGTGASSRGEARSTIEQLARDCLTVLDAAGLDKAALLGHSTGGCIAQAAGALAPERVEGLVLSGTWLKPGRYMVKLFETRLAVLDADPVAYSANATLMAYPPRWLEAHWNAYDAAIAEAPVAEAVRAVVRERIQALLSFDGTAGAAGLSMPALVIGTRDDIVVPAFQQEALAAALPGCRKTMLESGGHYFPVSRPDAFTSHVAE